MKRLFCLTAAAAALLVFTGACSSESEPAAGSAPISTEGNVDRIAFGEITMNGCDDANSVVGITFTSIGTGRASVYVTNPTTSAKYPNAIVAETKVDVTSNETHVDLSIDAALYQGGELTAIVQADNHQVADGQRGQQSARNELKIKDASNEKCRLSDERQIEWWQIAIAIASITTAIILILLIVRTLRKKRI